MIDKAKLEALDMVTLSKLRDAVNEVLCRKVRLTAARSVPFEVVLDDESKRPGQRIRITGIGNKHLQGYEIDATGNHHIHKRWRLAVRGVSVVPDFDARPKTVSVPPRTAANRPNTVHAAAF